jgi:hypothetical protein
MTEEQWIPESKEELMSAIKREWDALMNIAAKLEQGNKMTTADEGGWSPKDNLAHLAEWMNALMGYHMDRRPPHEVMALPEEVTKDWDFEVINPVLFERNRERTVEDVLDQLQQVYGELVDKLEATPFEDLLKPRHADDPEKRPLLMWILGDTTEHFLEHRETIEKML